MVYFIFYGLEKISTKLKNQIHVPKISHRLLRVKAKLQAEIYTAAQNLKLQLHVFDPIQKVVNSSPDIESCWE